MGAAEAAPTAPDLSQKPPGASVYFYELHEGDNDVFADLLLGHEDEMEPEEFFQTVRTVRERVIGSYHHDTLIEAIAEELERDYGFVYISDDRLTAAVNVSQDPDETYLAGIDGGRPGAAADDDDDEDEDDVDARPDYKAILVDFDPDAIGRTRPH
jgi:hypothetical protein